MSSRGYRHVAVNEAESYGDAAATRVARKGRRKRNLIVLTVVVVGVLILLLIGIGGYLAFRKKHKSPKHVCVTPDVCNSNLLDYIDDSHNPCEDFFAYSCGNWLANNPLNGQDAKSTFSQLYVDNYRHLREYLSNSITQNDSAAIKKSKYLYSACANVNFIKSHLLDHTQQFIRDAGGWDDIGISPDNGWSIDSNLANDHYLGSSALFQFIVAPDDLNSSQPVIRVAQGGLTLQSPQSYDSSDFNDLADNIAAVLGAVGNYYNVERIAYNIAKFERSLASHWLTDTELRNVSAQYNPMTLQQLATLFNMDWVGYFNTIFRAAGVSAIFTADTIVIVETPDYFRAINELVLQDRSTLANYARWQLLLGEFIYSTASLATSWTVMHEKKFPKSAKLSESASYACVEWAETSMPYAVARPFVDELIDQSTVDKVNSTISQIETAFLDNLLEKDWLDKVTKDRCIDKVDAITRQIAYPDFVKVDKELDQYYIRLQIDSSMNHFEIIRAVREFIYYQMFSMYTKPIDKTQWLAAPTEVNAYYSPEFNQFVFLAGILRPPMFATNWPPFLLYGGFGVIIGHELSHGFDDQGQQYNKDGNRVPWWTDQSAANFRERTECFVNQYNRYSLQGYQVDGQLTLGENIADNGGVHTAFRAYKNVMSEEAVNQSRIAGHTPDQLFFVTFAQVWCSKFSADSLQLSTQTDPHSPGRFRAIGSLVNNKDFAAAFNCPEGSKMNPANKCQLW